MNALELQPATGYTVTLPPCAAEQYAWHLYESGCCYTVQRVGHDWRIDVTSTPWEW